jgi:hypothetical protein
MGKNKILTNDSPYHDTTLRPAAAETNFLSFCIGHALDVTTLGCVVSWIDWGCEAAESPDETACTNMSTLWVSDGIIQWNMRVPWKKGRECWVKKLLLVFGLRMMEVYIYMNC